jgi:hypothetical protein
MEYWWGFELSCIVELELNIFAVGKEFLLHRYHSLIDGQDRNRSPLDYPTFSLRFDIMFYFYS